LPAAALGWLTHQRAALFQDEIAVWQDAAIHQPHSRLVRVNLGTLLAQSNRFDEAIKELTHAIRLDSKLTHAVRLESKLSGVHYNLARAYEASNQLERAEQHYRHAVQLEPADALSHYNLARILEDRGEFETALRHYQAAIRAEPTFAAAHTNLGILLMNQGDMTSAISEFRLAMAAQNDLTNTMNLVMILIHAGRTREAVPLAERALELAREEGNTQLVQQLEAALSWVR
jgi:tetratricopeptide (TPR) repeat protein